MSSTSKLDLLSYLDEPLVYKDEVVGYYGIGPDSMAFRFKKAVDPNNPAIRSFLLRQTLQRTKLAYPKFDFELVFEGGKILGILCNSNLDKFFLTEFISRVAWAVAKAI